MKLKTTKSKSVAFAIIFLTVALSLNILQSLAQMGNHNKSDRITPQCLVRCAV